MRLKHTSLLTAVLTLVVAAPAFSQSDVRWKFKEGQNLRMLLKTDVTTEANVQGNAIETKMAQVFTVGWKVKAVKSDGSAEIVQTFDRVELAMDSPFGEMKFDSDKKGEVEEGPLAGLTGPMKALVGAEMTMTMTPTGETKDMKIPAKVTEALGGGGGAAGMMFSPDSIKSMMQQSGPGLPDKPLKVDESFTTKRDMPNPLGTMTVETTQTYKGPDPKDAKIEIFETKSKMSLKPNADSPFEVSLGDQDSRGELRFNKALGRIDSATTVQQMEMKIKIMDMEITQNVTSKSVMTITEVQ